MDADILKIEDMLRAITQGTRRIERVDREDCIAYEVYIEDLSSGAGSTRLSYPWANFRDDVLPRAKAEAELFATAPVALRQLLNDRILLEKELADMKAAYAEVSRVNAELRQQLDAQIAENVNHVGDKRALQGILQRGFGVLNTGGES